MKITIFIGGLSGGGAERVVCNLSNFLSERHKVTILTMSDDPPAYSLNEDIERVSLIKNQESNNYIIKNMKRLIRFRTYIKNTNSDIFLVMLPGTINLLLVHRKLIKAPIVISERCNPYSRYETSKVKKWLMKLLYPRADGFVFQTKEAMKYYEETIGDKGIVIPNAINQEFVRERFTVSRNKKIVSAGRLTDQKNFSLLIEAFYKISDKHPDYKLVIFGDGPRKKELLDLVEKHKLQNKVEFPGYVNNFGDRLIGSSLFVLSSNYEGMPNALMEAMALGVPCISTNCPPGGPDFLIRNGYNGVLVPVGDVKRLADSIDNLLSDRETAELMAQNAKEIVSLLDSEKIYSRWETYLMGINSRLSN